MRAGWFKKAKAKWIRKNVYSFELIKYGFFSGEYDSFTKRHDNHGHIKYFGNKPNWYLDLRTKNFADQFIFCYSLRLKDKFSFSFVLKKDVKY